ncbi:MAG: glycosyltransferase family 1 protein [bacterium]
MNIIIDIRCLLEPDYSGVPAYAYNLLQNLLKIDQKNQYYLFYNKSEKHSEIIKKIGQLNNLSNYPNVKFVDFHYPNNFLNFSLRFLKYPKLDKIIEKKIGAKIDVWFSPNLGFVNFSHRAGSAMSPNLPDGFKFILTIHDLSFERHPEFFASKKNFGINYIRGRFWHKYVGAKKVCKQADKIIAVSESAKNDLMDIYKIQENKIRVIYEGANASYESKVESQKLNEEEFIRSAGVSQARTPACSALEPPSGDSSGASVKKKYNLPEKFVLFLGTLEPRKNISSIIRAFEKLSSSKETEHPMGCSVSSHLYSACFSTPENYHLIIAGKKGWLYDDLFKLAEKSKAKDKIKFIGYVSEEDKPALYKLASLFVFPSFYEGFGLPPLEAMACGTPVITSAVFSLSEVVGDVGILVDPYDVNELAQAMQMVLDDEKLRERMIEKGLKRSEMFSWEKAAGESLGVFDSNTPQKILIDARMAGTQNAGIGRSIEELIKNLIKIDTENEYYLFLNKENFFLSDKWLNISDEKELNFSGRCDDVAAPARKIHKILIDARRYTLKEQLILPKEIKKIKPDLAYFPHFNVPFFYRGKFIITIHDLIWIKYPRPRKEISTLGPFLYGIKNFFSKIIFKSAIEWAQTIITPTEFIKKDIVDFYKINPDKIKVVNWGIDNGGEQKFLHENQEEKHIFSTQRISDNALEKCYNINKQYFLYVGSAYPHKNLIFLLEVFKNINDRVRLGGVGRDENLDQQNPSSPPLRGGGDSDFQLVLAGKDSYFYQKLKQKVKELNLENKVIFTGYANDEDLNLLYKKAFAFVFASLLEGFGFPPLEAMRFGVPVLSSNTSCLPEIFGDAVLYFNPTNKKDLEEKILSIINNQDLREELIQKGFEQVKKYDWKICAEEYLDIINIQTYRHMPDKDTIDLSRKNTCHSERLLP